MRTNIIHGSDGKSYYVNRLCDNIIFVRIIASAYQISGFNNLIFIQREAKGLCGNKNILRVCR
jgi:hypothetical protein